MRRKLSSWGWAAAGAGIVIIVVWIGVSVWTAIQVHNDHVTITRIERVIGVGAGHPVGHHHRTPSRFQTNPDSGIRNGGDASTPPTGHSQPGPPSGGPHESTSTVTTERTQNDASSTTETTHEVVTIPPTPPLNPAPAAPVTEAVGGVVEETGHTLNETVGGTTEQTCTLAGVLCH